MSIRAPEGSVSDGAQMLQNHELVAEIQQLIGNSDFSFWITKSLIVPVERMNLQYLGKYANIEVNVSERLLLLHQFSARWLQPLVKAVRTEHAHPLRDLARKIEELAKGHQAYSQAQPAVSNLVDHLSAIARCHECNNQLNNIVGCTCGWKGPRIDLLHSKCNDKDVRRCPKCFAIFEP